MLKSAETMRVLALFYFAMPCLEAGGMAVNLPKFVRFYPNLYHRLHTVAHSVNVYTSKIACTLLGMVRS